MMIVMIVMIVMRAMTRRGHSSPPLVATTSATIVIKRNGCVRIIVRTHVPPRDVPGVYPQVRAIGNKIISMKKMPLVKIPPTKIPQAQLPLPPVVRHSVHIPIHRIVPDITMMIPLMTHTLVLVPRAERFLTAKACWRGGTRRSRAVGRGAWCDRAFSVSSVSSLVSSERCQQSHVVSGGPEPITQTEPTFHRSETFELERLDPRMERVVFRFERVFAPTRKLQLVIPVKMRRRPGRCRARARFNDVSLLVTDHLEKLSPRLVQIGRHQVDLLLDAATRVLWWHGGGRVPVFFRTGGLIEADRRQDTRHHLLRLRQARGLLFQALRDSPLGVGRRHECAPAAHDRRWRRATT
jgi:hypothetical protein